MGSIAGQAAHHDRTGGIHPPPRQAGQVALGFHSAVPCFQKACAPIRMTTPRKPKKNPLPLAAGAHRFAGTKKMGQRKDIRAVAGQS